MYGNLISDGNSIPQNDEPYYIYGVDNSFFAEGMSDRIIADYDDFLSRYSDVLSDEFKEKINSMKATVSNLSSMGEGDVKSFIDTHYANGIELIKLCGNEAFESHNTNMYHIYHKIGLEISDYLMTFDNTIETDGVERIDRLVKEYEASKRDIADEKSFARDILRHAKR